MSDLSLIKDLLSTSGSGRTGMKALVFGESGAGKSPFLASFPRPLVAIDCGTGGIQPYLKPPIDGETDLDRVKRGEEDICVTVNNPVELSRVVQWVLDNQDWLASVVIDEYNLAWEDHQEAWHEKLNIPEGKQIEFGQWRSVKREWKSRQKKLMKSKLHFGMSCWMRDISAEQVASKNPMVKPKVQIRQQEVAAIEKSVPYTTDLILQFSIVRDEKNRPTATHEVRVAKGRRPRTVKPEDLHVGSTWQFQSDREEDLWALTVGKFEHAWRLASRDEGEWMGDPEEEEIANEEERLLVEAGDESEAGSLIKAMLKAEEEGKIKTVADFANFWQRAVAPTINDISDEGAKRAVLAVKDQIKQRLEGK